ERPALQPFGEGLSLQELHGEEEDLLRVRLGGEQLEDPADVSVGDSPGEEDLATETLAHRRVAGQRGQDELEGHPGPEGPVLGLGDDAHSAARDDPDDLEALLEDVSRSDRDSARSRGPGCPEGEGAAGFSHGRTLPPGSMSADRASRLIASSAGAGSWATV